MNTALTWINSNYDGIRDWKKEYTGIREDLRNFNSYGRANILSKLRELKSSKLGIHYNDENSYQRNIIDGSYRIDIKNWNSKIITSEEKIRISSQKNYYYMYLTEGKGEVNGIHFSGNSSSFIIYSENSFEIKIDKMGEKW